MPMKYSTFRSKTCEPSRCSRIALFVSGVIQFRRPISSSGPHGLSETLSPSCSCSALNVNCSRSTSVMSCSSLVSGFDGRLLLDERAVEIRAPVAEEVELVLAWNDVVLVTRLLEVDVRHEKRLGRHIGLGESVAEWVDDLAASAELAPALLADAVRDEEVDAVLG